MTFSPAVLAEYLGNLEAVAGKPARYVIAFSGGLGSTALAHALSELKQNDKLGADVPILAFHIDHGLQRESSTWSEECARSAAA